MTREDLIEQIAQASLASAKGGKKLGVLALAVLMTLVTTAVAWAETKCLEHLTVAECQNPSLMRQLQLKAKLWQLERQARREHNAVGVDLGDDIKALAYEGFLSVGRGITESGLMAMKAGRAAC